MLIWYRLTAWLRGRGRLREVWRASDSPSKVYRIDGVPMSKRAYMALRYGVGVAPNE